MSFIKGVFHIRQPDDTVESLAVAFNRSKEIKDFVMAVIEGVIVLGAIKAAANVSNDQIILPIIYFAGLGALAVYILTASKLFMAFLIDEKFTWLLRPTRPAKFLHVLLYSVATAGVSIAIPYVLPALIATVIENNLIN